MEIERKYLIHKLPDHLEAYPHRTLEQAYLCTEPVVRVRRDADDYILTYKSKGLMMREEHNLPLTEEAYCHLREKADGRIITKERYCIPYEDQANSFTPPDWFGEDVTFSSKYHNSTLSQKKD